MNHYNFEDYAQELRFKLETTAKLASELLNKNKLLTTEKYDKNLNSLEWKIGDKILVLNEVRTKHDPLYIGPFSIIEINLPNVTYLDPKFNRKKTIHINNIQPFKEKSVE